jgi:hypothetical protein
MFEMHDAASLVSRRMSTRPQGNRQLQMLAIYYREEELTLTFSFR